MCTISFVPKSHGFYLAMNRDEKRERFRALAPTIIDLASRRVVLPREPTGGTWISANDAGVCLALINWHRVTREPKSDVASRALADESCAEEIADGVAKLPLHKLRPFRLIAIVPSDKVVTEWRWNLEWLTMRNHQWQLQHWFSSGFDERTVERVRAKVCASFVAGGGDPGRRETSRRGRRAGVNAAGCSLKWLRRLHRSHEPERGPFSICMHRPTAATVSYTEVAVGGQSVVMCYKDGPPCSRRSTTTKTCKLSRVRTTNR